MKSEQEQLETFRKHILQHEDLQNYMAMGGDAVLLDLPICPKCETVGLRHTGYMKNKTMVCPKCGYHNPSPMTLKEFIDRKLFLTKCLKPVALNK